MSICKACNGTGMVDDPMWADEAHTMQYLVARLKKCPACDGKGFVEQTNEEWLKSLDTEGLVDHLYEVHKGGNTVERQAWIEKHKERVKMQIRGWLKEVHKDG